MKCPGKCLQASANHRGGIDVEGSSVCGGQGLERDGFAVEFGVAVAGICGARRSAWTGETPVPTLIRKSWRPQFQRCCRALHLRLPGPAFTLRATTVWSSKVSTPAAWSGTALKISLTTQSADLVAHPATIASTRSGPKEWP